MMKRVATALGLTLALAGTSSCAMTSQLVLDPLGDRTYNAEPGEMSEGGIPVNISRRNINPASNFLPVIFLDITPAVLDVYAGANIALTLLRFSDVNAAFIIPLTIGVGLAAADHWLTWNLWTDLDPDYLEAQIDVDGGDPIVRRFPLTRQNGGLYAKVLLTEEERMRGPRLLLVNSESRRRAQLHAKLPTDVGDVVTQASPISPASKVQVLAPKNPKVDVDQPLPKLAPTNPTAAALVIGIEHYGDDIPGVPFALRDASAMKTYVNGALGVAPDRIISMTDSQATKTRVQLALGKKLKELVKRDESDVYIYFAGHGIPDPKTGEAYLVTADGAADDPAETCLSVDQLYKYAKDLGARNVYVMLDACFSGTTGRSAKATAILPGSRPLHRVDLNPSVPEGVTVLAAADTSQVSSSYDEMGHGLFTYFLLKALRGDGPKGRSIDEIHQYVRKNVAAQARLRGRTQTPQLIDDGNGEKRELGGR